MYRVISIYDDEMTRLIKLKNSDTGMIEECFDNSRVLSDENFSFMELEHEYDCKIKLFGNVAHDDKSKAILCTVVCKEVQIGTRKLVKVVFEDNYYYIPKGKVGNVEEGDTFYFQFSRKDLIQVDNVIHADLL